MTEWTASLCLQTLAEEAVQTRLRDLISPRLALHGTATPNRQDTAVRTANIGRADQPIAAMLDWTNRPLAFKLAYDAARVKTWIVGPTDSPHHIPSAFDPATVPGAVRLDWARTHGWLHVEYNPT
ncbi:hypothetical protein [Candidatus Roseilinea sp. NK_OTU-006]|jgi:hypothetical protein|uniref:hypothetical protein n=1 Tax=Candidatus Roseilinea sp. NK_OTU-006 TaxID=2704250 RepID=UPI00145E4AED|nr:hypothetical protein [Candidatus Roseilinea sp. NK_OTU-006]